MSSRKGSSTDRSPRRRHTFCSSNLAARQTPETWRLQRSSTRSSKNEGYMRIEIICTGDEVLTGKIVNTNFSYMTQKLEDFGISVSWGTIVGDDREELLAAFRLSGERADAVIVNGGGAPPVFRLFPGRWGRAP